MLYQFSKGISGGLLGLAAAVCAVGLAGCGSQKSLREPQAQVQIKNMSNAQAHADFLQLTQSLRDQYGPLQYKEARFHFDFEKLAAASLAEIDASSTDLEYFGIMAKFLGSFHDGHVSFRVPLLSAVPFRSLYVPIALTHVAGKALVEWVDTSALKDIDVARGYELVSIDGQDPMTLAAQLAQYQSSGNDESDKMRVYSAFYRGSYMGPYFPKSSTVNATFRRPDGSLVTHSLQWRAKNDQLIDLPEGSASGKSHDLQGYAAIADEYNSMAGFQKMGSIQPFFATDAVQGKFHFSEVVASDAYLEKWKTDSKKAGHIFAALYKHKGKTVLLLRNSSYENSNPDSSTEEDIKTYKALLDQYGALADVLVLDQTHNPGGSLEYAIDFASLFTPQDAPGFVQAFRTDRKWISEFRSWAYEVDKNLQAETAKRFLNISKTIETAADAGQFLTAPIPFFGDNYVRPNKDLVWTKPVLMLTDELAGSCGDIVPMLLKKQSHVKIFGKRTMGLGGNVEGITLSASQAQVKYARGMFTSYKPANDYVETDFVENNGVQPDIAYEHTVEDFRAGFVNYVQTFSDTAAEMVAP